MSKPENFQPIKVSTQTLLVLMGLPASGKSTFARNLVLHGWVRVNKDDIRRQLAPDGSRPNEKEVLKERDFRVRKALREGKCVVVDDTNLNPIHPQALRKIADEFGAEYQTRFFDVDLRTCMVRDEEREESVGVDVIQTMHQTWLSNFPRDAYKKAYGVVDNRPVAYMCDLDGTLAINTQGRFHYGEQADKEYVNDQPNTPVVEVIKSLMRSGINVIYVSGRTGTELGTKNTIQWLRNNGLWDEENSLIFFRKEKDFRLDSSVKTLLYKEHIEPRWKILGVFDDRPQVIKAWWDLGLFVFDVGPHREF